MVFVLWSVLCRSALASNPSLNRSHRALCHLPSFSFMFTFELSFGSYQSFSQSVHHPLFNFRSPPFLFAVWFCPEVPSFANSLVSVQRSTLCLYRFPVSFFFMELLSNPFTVCLSAFVLCPILFLPLDSSTLSSVFLLVCIQRSIFCLYRFSVLSFLFKISTVSKLSVSQLSFTVFVFFHLYPFPLFF